jgi:putative transposase
MKEPCRFRSFKTSLEVIHLAAKVYVRFPLSLRNMKNLPDASGIKISHRIGRFWWNRFGPSFAAEIRNRQVSGNWLTVCPLKNR